MGNSLENLRHVGSVFLDEAKGYMGIGKKRQREEITTDTSRQDIPPPKRMRTDNRLYGSSPDQNACSSSGHIYETHHTSTPHVNHVNYKATERRRENHYQRRRTTGSHAVGSPAARTITYSTHQTASPRASQKDPPGILPGSLPRGSPGQAYNFDIYANQRNLPATAHRTGFNFNVAANPPIGKRVPITQYSEVQWKGNTNNAVNLRKGYDKARHWFQGQPVYVQVIRGDNYCAIRSTIYQVLESRLPLDIRPLEEVKQELDAMLRDNNYRFIELIFAKDRLSTFNRKTFKQNAEKCLECLYSLVYRQHNTSSSIQQYLNSSDENDVCVMEAVKILMTLKAIDLWQRFQLQDTSIPVFGWILFARDTSLSIEALVQNHIHNVGDSGGLEQIEMHLLAYTLGINIRAFRLKQMMERDFVTHYNEEMGESHNTRRTINIISEDDRHYNILTTEQNV